MGESVAAPMQGTVPLFGRVVLFLLLALGGAGALRFLGLETLWAVGAGLALAAAAVSKIEGGADRVSWGLAVVGCIALLTVELFPSSAQCGRYRSQMVELEAAQAEAVEYWRACSAPVGGDVDWCADHRPQRSLEQMRQDREGLMARLADRC